MKNITNTSLERRKALAVSIKDAAEMLGGSTRSIRRLIERGHLRPILLLRKKLVPVAQLEALVINSGIPNSKGDLSS
jgi:hypothetical protein